MGINNIHSNSIIPIRASKKHKLTDDEKWYNNEISKVRIAIEHVNAFIKKFKITSTRYRNRRKNFKLYMSLICGIYNFETANLQFTDRPNLLLMQKYEEYYLENGSLLPNLEISEIQKILDLKLKNIINNILGYLIGDVVSDYLVQNNIRLEEAFYPYVLNNYHAIIKKLELE